MKTSKQIFAFILVPMFALQSCNLFGQHPHAVQYSDTAPNGVQSATSGLSSGGTPLTAATSGGTNGINGTNGSPGAAGLGGSSSSLASPDGGTANGGTSPTDSTGSSSPTTAGLNPATAAQLDGETTTPGSSSGNNGNNNTMMIAAGVGGVALLGVGAYLLTRGGGAAADAACNLNTENYEAYATVGSTTCPVSDAQNWVKPSTCAQTSSSVTGIQDKLKPAFENSVNAVTNQGASVTPAAAGAGGAAPVLAAGYAGSAKVAQSTADSIKNNIDTATPFPTQIGGEITKHQNILTQAQGVQLSGLNQAIATCNAAQALRTNPATATEAQASITWASNWCNGVILGSGTPADCISTCSQAQTGLQTVITEQQKMIAALQKAQTDANAKLAAMNVCQSNAGGLASNAGSAAQSLVSAAPAAAPLPPATGL